MNNVPATMVVYGRWWYDWLTLVWVIAFFLIEMLLLFRSTLVGWAMTAKCLALAFVFTYSLLNPPPELRPEDITVIPVMIRLVLIAVLSSVIVILVTMRMQGQTVVVGKDGTTNHG